ncbi:S8 family peptidase [Nonomuraea sp. NPDC050556]|uniref:S8 family peptidase n=1 Tax=Nonomuraea sp. NPDC050556 TaxID=3364369 RepID=UPI0037A509EA
MRLRRLIACVALLVILPAAPAFADDPPPSGEKLEAGLAVTPGVVRAIVEVTDPAQNAPVAAESEADVVLQPVAQPFIVVEGTADELAELADDPRVANVHRDRTFPPAAANNLKVIGADRAHAEGATGTGQVVAILDTGIDRDHPAFAGKIVGEACFSAVEQGVESLCPNGATSMTGAGAADAETARCLLDTVNLCEHGSHVAGIASAVAPGAGIVAVQVFSRVNDEETCGEPSCLLAYESSLRLAMDHVASLAGSQPIAALNLSLGGMPYETSCDDDVFKPKIDDLLSKGVATVVAAGNEYFEGASFPGCISSAVTVGASDDADAIADFSNRGPLVDVFAPGVDIESAVPDDATAVHSGTSMATPHVTGALAVLKSRFPGTPIGELVEKLRTTGRPLVYGSATTPRIDLYAAITGAAASPPITQSPSPSDEPQPSSGPSPSPTVNTPAPTPIPLPTITVTVTVTATPAAAVCTRGTAGAALTARQWAVEIHRSSGTMPDTTLSCYLRLVQKASKVFPELTKASTLGTAYRVLRASKTGREKADSVLLTGWLNWANGAARTTTTLRSAERLRLSPAATDAQLRKLKL